VYEVYRDDGAVVYRIDGARLVSLLCNCDRTGHSAGVAGPERDPNETLRSLEAADARVIDYRAGCIKLTVEIDCEAATLIVAESWMPGWRCFVDGAARSIRPFRGALLAVRVGPGQHRLSFHYRPASVAAGRLVSLASLAACLACLLAAVLGRR